jgi:hypothetical protein
MRRRSEMGGSKIEAACATVYVVGFVTPGSSGGFDWRIGRQEVETIREHWLGVEGEEVSEVRAVEVPFAAPLNSIEDVTNWIEARHELWEP